MINQTEGKPKISIKTYLIDTVTAGSPEHQNLIKFQKVHWDHFPTILAIRINDKNPTQVQALALEDLYPIDAASFGREEEKMMVVFEVLQALWALNKKQYCTGLKPLAGLLFYEEISKKIMLKPYMAVPIQGFKFQEPKKDKLLAKSGIELCFNYPKIPGALDVWKWAVFAASLLFQFQLQKYIEKVLATEKIAQFQPQITAKNTARNHAQLIKSLTLCLSVDPYKRPQFHQLALLFQKFVASSFPFDENCLSICKQIYLKKEQGIKSQAGIQITQQILLTEDLKKKISKYYLQHGLKAAKSYKPVYRATRFNFSTRVFYEMCSGKGRLLFIIDTQENGTICCYIDPVINLCQGSGLSGQYIADPNQKSFIYSTKNQQSYKLQNKDKAYRSVPGKGPIIGDGDIILSSNRLSNWSHFPKSYQAGKNKTLVGKQQFSIRNYDVYMVTF